MTYTAIRCPCGHRACESWMVEPVAAVQGVSFTEEQARAVAALLNRMPDVTPDFLLTAVILTEEQRAKLKELVTSGNHQGRLEVIPKESCWQPIATAPRSGLGAPRRYVLVRGPSGIAGTKHFVTKAYHDAQYRPLDPWRAVDNSSLSDAGWEPTEWMEIPQ